MYSFAKIRGDLKERKKTEIAHDLAQEQYEAVV
jgi:hypothetical protein